MKSIEVLGLKKYYGNIKAVDGVDFYVEPGSLFAFLGPNGAGKSTVIDILCTLSRPQAGQAFINGMEIGREDEKIRSEIGVVFQEGVLDRLLSVRENLMLRGSFYGLKGEELKKRTGNALLEADAAEFADDATYADEYCAIRSLYDIFMKNGTQLRADFRLLTAGRHSQPLSDSCVVIGPRCFDDGMPAVFLEEGASVEAVSLNTSGGPIYIGRNATVMEGSCIRAPFAACEKAQVNMGSKIYGATTLGPYCKVGGELNNVVMFGFSNKAHDGFLGNAVIGEWCNIGAGTNASNLKNDYTEIKLWNYRAHRFLRTGLQFCGLIMGDHSKAGINCMFNTATVIGVGVNIHGAGFPRNFVASFSEGGATGYADVSVAKFFDIAKRMMARRNIELNDVDKEIFENIYRIADNYK